MATLFTEKSHSTESAHNTERSHAPQQVAHTTPTRKPKMLAKRMVIVADPEHDLAWLGRLRSSGFDPMLLTTNFDAVQMLLENRDLHMVLFAQRSLMMDGIAAAQLLRQSRSEDDAAIVLMLNENLDHAVIEAFAAGVSDVVCHPFHTGELIARLDATLQRLMFLGEAETESIGFQSEPPAPVEMDEPMMETPPIARPKHMRAPKPTAPADPIAVESPATPQSVEQPAPEARVTTRLAGDWLLSHDLPHGMTAPSLDLSQLKFVSPMTTPQIETARQRGELSEVLLDRVWVCPQCHALPSFRPACPCCGSAGVEQDRMLHHYACAFVGPTSEFRLNDEGLACPKCCAQRLMVGTDCEFLDGPHRCSDCDWSAAELEIVGHCMKCGFRFPAQQAVLEDVIGLCPPPPKD